MAYCSVVKNTFFPKRIGIPGLIVVLMAAIQPSTYDMSTILYKDITCGTLKLRGTEERERYLIQWKKKGDKMK